MLSAEGAFLGLKMFCRCLAKGDECMGIRFYCPNGHKLNVKEFQAGQHGVCPKCHAKFDIPFESTRLAGSKDLPAAKEWEERARREGLFPYEKQEKTVLQDINLNMISTNVNEVPLGMDASAGLSGASILASSNANTPASKNVQPTSASISPASTPAPAPAPTPAPPSLPDPFAGPADTVWYVRPATGEQLGPLDRDVVKSWLNAGRISADTLVWREGWADWKAGSEVFESLAGPKNIFGF